jgi:hypothetical protein
MAQLPNDRLQIQKIVKLTNRLFELGRSNDWMLKVIVGQ